MESVLEKTQPNRCIYCPTLVLDGGSREHCLTAALGNFRNAPVLTNRICADCNQKLGLLEEQLVRCGPEAFFKQLLGIQGVKRGKKREFNPFYRGSAGGKRPEVSGIDRATGERVQLNGKSELTGIHFLTKDGRQVTIALPPEVKTRAQFLALCKANEVLPAKEANLWAAAHELERVRHLVGSLVCERTEWWDKKFVRTYTNVVIKTKITPRYFRALAKIAFHHFLYRMHQYTGHEDVFDGIRHFIADEDYRRSSEEFVARDRIPLSTAELSGARLSHWCHIVSAEVDSRGLIGRVQLFAGPERKSPTYKISLGDNLSLCSPNMAEATVYQLFPAGNRREYEGEAKLVTRHIPVPQR